MLESQSWKNKIVPRMGRLKRWWYLSKLLTITILSFNFFNCLVKLLRNLKLKFRSKFNHDFTNHGYLHSAAWKTLYSFKGNVQFVQKVTFELLMDSKQNHYWSGKNYKCCYFWKLSSPKLSKHTNTFFVTVLF